MLKIPSKKKKCMYIYSIYIFTPTSCHSLCWSPVRGQELKEYNDQEIDGEDGQNRRRIKAIRC